MAVYFITGKLGSGKTLCAVGRIRDYLEQGRKVATNLDLNLEYLVPTKNKTPVYRLPDKPRLQDMELIGRGCSEEDENKYGAIVLDELGTWFNTRNWNDKERLPLIDWFLHARKKHWDVYFIVQDIDSIDKQLRNSLCEHLVICRRTDRLTLPIIGTIMRMFGFDKFMPKIHVASVHYGDTPQAIRVARWWYRARELYKAYDTAQVFTDDLECMGGQLIDLRSTYQLVPNYYRSRQFRIDKLNDEIQKIREEKSQSGSFMARSDFDLSPRDKKSIIILFVILIVCWYGFTRSDSDPELSPEPTTERNSLDQPALSDTMSPMDLSTDLFGSSLPALSRVQAEENKQSKKVGEYFIDLLAGSIDSQVGVWKQNGAELDAIIYIKYDDKPLASITLDDLRVLGWTSVRRGDFIFLTKEGYDTLTFSM